MIGIGFGGAVARSTGILNVKSYGAVGDGVTDDTTAINTAVQAAKAQGKNVFLPSGTYLFDAESDYFGAKYGIRLSSTDTLAIIGEPGTKITTDLVGSTNNYRLFYIESCQNITFCGIEFENTHGITTNSTYAITTIGATGSNFVVTGCKFSGFYNTLLLNSGKTTRVEDNYFYAPLGHDNAANNSNPAVYVRVISNASGTNRDLIVRNNFAEGYSGTDISTTTGQRAMDGFYYGYADGAIVENNTCIGFGVEAIFSQGYEKYLTSADIRPTIIRGNYIDSTVYSGSTTTSNYGIVADGANHQIYNNHIRAGYGILCYGATNAFQYKNTTLRGNRIIPLDGMDVTSPIFVAGYATAETYPATGFIIEGNDIVIKDLTLTADLEILKLADANYALVKNNNIYIDNIAQDSNEIDIYNFAQNVDFVNYGGENVWGTYDNLLVNDGSNTNITNI